MERRTFVSVVGGAGIGILLPYAFYRYLTTGIHASYVGVKDYLRDGPQAALRAITPTGDFYVMTSRNTPSVDAATWSLAIDGLVEKPLRFSYDEMRRLPRYETTLTLECISNNVGGGYIGNAQWAGTLLKPLLERARPKEAIQAVLHAAEGYTSAHPVDVLLRDGVFLAHEMNGEPLARAHGFPLRIFIPGKYGMKMPKWLTRIQFVNYEHLGFWEWQGWSNKADRQLCAILDDPRDGNRISGGAFLITGYAVADAAGVVRVEISFDDGKIWQDTEIFSNPIPSQMWAFWKYDWKNPPRGKHTLRVRAVDGAGRVQTAEKSGGEWPSGATGHHSITVNVS